MERSGIFRLSKFFGVFPFRCRDGVLQADRLSVVYSFVFNAIIGATYAYNTVKEISISHISSYRAFLSTSFYTCHMVALFRFPFNIYYQREAVAKAIHDLNTLETSFREMGLEIKNCFRKRIVWFEITVPVLCGIVFYFGKNANSIISAFGLTVVLLEIALVCGQFCFLVDSVSDFFDSGIKSLRFIAHPKSRLQNMRTVEGFVMKTGRLLSVLRSLNSIYSRQILMSMAVHFFAIIVQLYYVFYNSTSVEEWRRMCLPGDLLMVSYRFYFVWRVSHSAAQAGSKFKEFNTLLYELMIEDKTNEIIRNDILKLYISTKREVSFTACGFFDVDYTLVHSMIASATTYLVILIQFE